MAILHRMICYILSKGSHLSLFGPCKVLYCQIFVMEDLMPFKKKLFLNKDISFARQAIIMKSLTLIPKVLMEGKMYKISHLCFSFHFMLKNG